MGRSSHIVGRYELADPRVKWGKCEAADPAQRGHSMRDGLRGISDGGAGVPWATATPWAPLHSRHTFFCPSWLLSQAENLLWGSDAIPAPDSGGPCLLGGAALFVLTPLALLGPGLRGIGMPATVPQLYTWLSNIGTARLCNNYQHVTVLGLLRAVLCQSRTCWRRRAARFTVPRRG